MIIDFHAHTFPDKVAGPAMTKMSAHAKIRYFSQGTLSSLIESTERSGIDYSLNLPVATSCSQVEKINRLMVSNLEYMKEHRILTFGAMHPEYDNYKEEINFLRDNGIKGIKIHPAYQGYDFNDIRYKRILAKATEEDLTVITHAGLDIGIPHHNYTDLQQIREMLDEVAPHKLVLAHMGQCFEWDLFEKELAGAPVYIDTAYCCGQVAKRPELGEPFRSIRLTGEEFTSLCRKHGTDRVLFGTDSPWEDQKVYLDRIVNSGLSREELSAVLGENARKLLQV